MDPGRPTALQSLLAEAEAALARGDADAADIAMAAAADICAQMQSEGKTIAVDELGALQELAERCGASLARLGAELNAESRRDDNHRRGLMTYQASQRR